jgi:hypothetical protein
MLQNDGLIDNVRVQPHNGGQFVPYCVGLWLSALNAIYRDVRYVVPFRAILDVRLACRISNLACPREMAATLRAESDGWGDRGLPLVADGHRRPAKPDDAGVGGRGGGYPGSRDHVFSVDGDEDRRRSIRRVKPAAMKSALQEH